MAHLLRKALNATPKGGALEVWGRCVQGDAVKVWVGKESGSGIFSELRERIVDPFFSTKGSSGQVGLGRSLYRAIAEAHRGSVSVESTVGAGSTCTGESSRAELVAASAPPAPAARDLRLRALYLLRGRHLRGPKPLRLRCRPPISLSEAESAAERR